MTKSSKPQYILFDIDGVVNNSRYFSFIYSEKHNVPLDVVQKVFDDGRKDLTNVGKADLKDVMSEVLDEWQWKGTVDELIDLWFETDLNIDERVITMIKKLRKKGIKCYVASDQEKYRTEYIWDVRNIKDYFDGKFISCEVGYVKYQKEFFDIALSTLKVSAHEVLYIDDSLNKLDVAKQVGIKTYLYKNFEAFEEFITSAIA